MKYISLKAFTVLMKCRQVFNEIPNKKTRAGYTYDLVKDIEEIVFDSDLQVSLPGLYPDEFPDEEKFKKT